MNLEEAAEQALKHLDSVSDWDTTYPIGKAKEALRQALAQHADAVPGFTATEPRQSVSRMKPGDRFILVRTSEIYHIKQDGSQWNETRQRPARLHKNSQVRLIVDAVNISEERVDETVKGEQELWPSVQCACGGTIYFKHTKREWVGLTHEERDEIDQSCRSQMEALFAIEAKLKEKNT